VERWRERGLSHDGAGLAHSGGARREKEDLGLNSVGRLPGYRSARRMRIQIQGGKK